MRDTIDLIINKELKKVNVVRYFFNNDNRYLIFTLNEVEDDHVKLYVCKMQYNDITKATTISDEDEWNRIKELIRRIIAENKMGNPLSIIDLNYSDIKGIEVEDYRWFSTTSSLVEVLGDNKRIFEDTSDVMPELPTNFQDVSEPDENITVTLDDLSYKKLYLKEIENRKIIEQELKKYMEIVNKFKDKIQEINQIIN